jgi:hypothetical protein
MIPNDIHDAELTNLRAEWQALGAQSDFAESLVRRARRHRRRVKQRAALEVLGVLFLSAVMSWLIVRRHGDIEVVLVAAVILLFVGAWIFHFFEVHAKFFASHAGDVATFVSLTRDQLAGARKWNRFARAWLGISCALLVPWGFWTAWNHRSLYAAEPWRAVVGYGVAITVFVLSFAYNSKNERNLRREQEAFERQLEDASLQ